LALSEKVRIEVYVPDLPRSAYRNLLDALEQEFTYTFGGCTVIRGLGGSYLSQLGLTIQDRVNIIYTDAPLMLTLDDETLSRYADELRDAADNALDEEAILVSVFPIFHAERP
jgi:hypothetical protein